MNRRIFLLYFLLLAGGLWNALGVLQEAMQLLAGPLIIALGIWTFIEAFHHIRRSDTSMSRRFIQWSVIVAVLSIAVEGLGVHTGLVFGAYSYGEVLQPQVLGVPIAIGFAWLTMLIASWAVVQRAARNAGDRSAGLLALVTALVMTGFDSLMEPAAIALGYWQWDAGNVPLLNYATWFALSFLFALAALRTKSLPAQEFRSGFHVFFAQAGYFVLTTIGAYTGTL